jgi:hypothetical protein
MTDMEHENINREEVRKHLRRAIIATMQVENPDTTVELENALQHADAALGFKDREGLYPGGSDE